jgi:hypothetical protein
MGIDLLFLDKIMPFQPLSYDAKPRRNTPARPGFICGRDLAHRLDGVGHLVHEEVMVMSKDRDLARNIRKFILGRPVGPMQLECPDQRGKNALMLRPDVDGETRPKQVEFGKCGLRVARTKQRKPIGQQAVYIVVVIREQGIYLVSQSCTLISVN